MAGRIIQGDNGAVSLWPWVFCLGGLPPMGPEPIELPSHDPGLRVDGRTHALAALWPPDGPDPTIQTCPVLCTAGAVAEVLLGMCR